MGRRARPPAATPDEAVQRVLDDPVVTWFGVRHHSPACALHVERCLRALRPRAVLVEGPDDATDSIPWLVDPRSRPPLAILSTWVDSKDRLGLGRLEGEEPARYRGWWPLPGHGPELTALRVGAELGAELAFVDLPLRAALEVLGPTAPEVADDRALAESGYFRSLAARTGQPSFGAFWDGHFEAGAAVRDTEAFRRAVLTFAWCARRLGEDATPEVDDANRVRESHMRWHVDQAKKRHPDGPILVVTGAYHAVALPEVVGKRAKVRADRHAATLVTVHGHRAHARLLGDESFPRWADEVLRSARSGANAPLAVAAERLLVEITHRARAAGHPIGTADAVGAVQVAHGLASLRRVGEPTPRDLLDGVRAALVKGAAAETGPALQALARAVLIGDATGELPPEAGRPPLLDDWYAAAKAHRLDLSGGSQQVRCDLHRQERHRGRSAFLHQNALLEIPMFGELDAGTGDRPFFRGPDPVERADLHLLGETWAVEWSPEVDDRLLELAVRGPTVAAVAEGRLRELSAAAGADVAARAEVLLRAAQCRSVSLLPDLLADLSDALATEARFAPLARALQDLVLLLDYRDAWPTHGDAGVAAAVALAWSRACLAIPSLGRTPEEGVGAAISGLNHLVRLAVGRAPSGVAPDRALLVERLEALRADGDGQAAVRGAAVGLLHALGALPDALVARELRGYFDGPLPRVLQGGGFLEGLLRTRRAVFTRSPRLLREVHHALLRLDDDAFHRLLPDLRRAFSVFVPAELQAIGGRVEQLVAGALGSPAPLPPVSDEAAAAARVLDSEVARALRGLWPEGPSGPDR